MSFKEYEFMSPFEFKNVLEEMALLSSKKKKNGKKGCSVLNAGRGNPNYLIVPPRLAFSYLNLFSTKLADEKINSLDLGLQVDKKNIGDKFFQFLKKYEKEEGVLFLKKAVDFAVKKFHFNKDLFIYSLVDAILGDLYPTPPRILIEMEEIIKAYVFQILGIQEKRSDFDLFATEGGSAAMVYLFKSLKINKVLKPNDSIAIITPIFSPYLEMPHLSEYNLIEVFLSSKEEISWQISDEEIKKLADPKIKALFVVNPANPSSYCLDEKVLSKIEKFIKTKRPDLIVISDAVYAPFINGFESLVSKLPKNTICVYSFSKYFGVTGWRLGFIMAHKKNIIDKKLNSLKKEKFDRYNIVSSSNSIPFIERLVLDSRDVALAHTAGLSGPQQVMMTLLALHELIDEKKSYKKNVQEMLKARNLQFFQGLDLAFQEKKGNAHYYVFLDLLFMAEKKYGKEFALHLEKKVDPLEFLFKLAKEKCTVILPGKGFHGNNWTFRISLANLLDKECAKIGKNIKEVLDDFYEKFKRKFR
jgi:aspartate 4-decarboxylase